MKNLGLYLDNIERCDDIDRFKIHVRLTRPYSEDLKLWYSIPFDQWEHCSCDLMDSFVLAALLKAMEDNATLKVHGPVSRSLLDNLEEYQLIFSLWFPEKYKQIEIIPDSEVEEKRSMIRSCSAFPGVLMGHSAH